MQKQKWCLCVVMQQNIRISWQEPYKVQQRETQSSALRRNNPMHQHRLGTNQVESSFVEKALGIRVDSTLTMSQQRALTAKKANSLLDCIRESIASRSRALIFSLCSALVRHFWGPSTRETRTYWSKSSEGLWRWSSDWSICRVRTGWESWDCSAWRREGSGGSYRRV